MKLMHSNEKYETKIQSLHSSIVNTATCNVMF